ncbi:MAG: pyruvate kinase [Epulopiscium sp. Nele67-Bin004]|nr:MAG: pyruvate kinase [Epulopiscium sp. Nele67-Bin004]
MRKTKIIATIGPKTNDIESIKKIITTGADAIRINFSHGDREGHAEVAKRVMQAREELGIHTALVLDTKGPEIRTGVLAEGDVTLVAGQTLVLTTTEIEGNSERVSVTYEELPNDLNVGNTVLVDDGLIELTVTAIEGTEITCNVVNGGLLGSRKGVNIPNVSIKLPALTEKDILDIAMGAEMGFDFIAASFIRCASDVIKIRKVLEENGGHGIQIISKIENREGVDNIDAILQVTDAIMVARGDLGVEIPPEEVPVIQKLLINKSNELGKPVVTATQMLESMITNPRPTRAEASDVANAIFDGTSIIMLSGETAKGDYPLESIEMMVRIAKMAEKTQEVYNRTYTGAGSISMTTAMSYSATQASHNLDAAAIVTVTKSGYTARSLSKYKPEAPIFACTTEERTARQMNLVWGCIPALLEIKDGEDTDTILENAVLRAEELEVVEQGDVVVITAGVPFGIAGTTNELKVQYVGNVLARGVGVINETFTEAETVTGTASVVKVLDEAAQNFEYGNILVTKQTTDDYLWIMSKASAIVVEDETPVEKNHAARIGKTLNIPVVIATGVACETVKNGATITVDSVKGLVFHN